MTPQPSPHWPQSTYRFQFHAGFTFADAEKLCEYLQKLGISHAYSSPYLKAKPGSTHGYDVIDHCMINPELGGREALDRWCAALAQHGLSHILDIVPNHVGVATNDNTWWNDVLENGPDSPFANHFDIDWTGSPRPELHNKLLLPVLGAPYAQVLENGELQLVFDDKAQKHFIQYHDRRFPLRPGSLAGQPLESFTGQPGDASSWDRLDALLSQQHYRLAWWKTASDEINYRRFFDINDLAALAMEHPEVFDATHTLIFELMQTGQLTGLRIDHPDGLYDPAQYLQRLQEKRPNSYVVVEKILAADEELPQDWPVAGTTGYDFLNIINGLYIDPAARDPLTRLYHDFTGQTTDFADLVYQKKLFILDTSLASELAMLTHRLDRLAQQHRHSRDFTRNALHQTLRQTIACFPVYRTYIDDNGVSGIEIAHINNAIESANARTQNPPPVLRGRAGWGFCETVQSLDPSLFHFLRDTLLLRFGDETLRTAQRAFAGKFQQLTAPVTAKGIEDTAFYIFNRFVSLNEVGGDPDHFGHCPQHVHDYLARRQKHWPFALSALSTHDTKRSEDVRARLNVLSEVPEEWRAQVLHWRALNAKHKTGSAPDPNDEYLLYQTLIGAWPLNEEIHDTFITRIQAYMQKAQREAKTHTRWTAPNEEYESATAAFIQAILHDQKFLNAFLPFVQKVARFGLLNSLSQTLLRLTAPGVPDTYQGTELWDFSLVDPDNRRPVDNSLRQQLLSSLPLPHAPSTSLAKNADRVWERVGVRVSVSFPPRVHPKLHLITTLLHLRKKHPTLFTTADYIPLAPTGPRAANLFAFLRRDHDTTALVLAPRFFTRILTNTNQFDWSNTTLPLENLHPLHNPLTGQVIHPPHSQLPVAQLLSNFPVGLWTSAR